MNYNVKLDLNKIPGAFRKAIHGKTTEKECVCIPIDNLFEGKTGAVYLDLTMVERKEVSQYGDTHFAKIRVSADDYKNMSEEDRMSIPIVGSVKPIQYQQQEPQRQQAQQQQQQEKQQYEEQQQQYDDLPF